MQDNTITQRNFATENALDSGNVLALINPTTKERASIAALAVIATPDLIQRRDALLDRAAEISSVENQEQADRAVAIAGDLKRVLDEIEASRKAIKNPFDQIAKGIQDVAKATSAPVETDRARLNGLVSSFIAKQEREAAEARRRAEAKARAAQERAAAKQREADAEAKRLLEEAEKAKKSGNLEEAFDLECSAADAQTEAAQPLVPAYTPPPAAKVQMSGAAISRGWGFEVVNLHKLLAAHPECVELVAKAQAIQNAIKAEAARLDEGEIPSIPGLKIFPKVGISNR